MKKTKKRKKFLIIKSGFKTSLNNFGQLIGLGFLVTTAIFVGLSVIIATSRVDKSYNNLLNSSIQHDFIVDVDNSTRISFDEQQWIGGENIDEFSNQDLYSQYLINVLARKGIVNENGITQGDSLFSWSRTEGRLFSNVKMDDQLLNVKALTKTSIIDERFEDTKSENINVDKIVLENEQKDSFFSTDKNKAAREVIIQANFAHQNNIKRGDIIRLTADNYGSQLLVKKDIVDLPFGNEISINDTNLGIDTTEYKEQVWFQVIGFGTSADFVYPVTNFKSTIPSTEKNLIAYVDPSIFGLNLVEVKSETNTKMQIYSYDISSSKLNFESESDREVYFSGKFRNKSNNSETFLRAFNSEWIKYGNLNTQTIKIFYNLRDTQYKYFFRTATYRHVIWVYWVFSTFLLVLIALISVFIVILIVKKQIDETRTKLGTFSSLGYSNTSLLMFFAATPIIISIVGTLIGYLLILFVQNFIIDTFGTYFNVHYAEFNAIPIEALITFLAVFIGLFLITLLIAYIVIGEGALTLLVGNTIKKNSKFGRGIKFLFRNRGPSLKLHAALVMGSTGKIFGTSITLLISTILISTALITPLVMEENSKATFSGLNYKDVVEYNTPVSNNPSTFLKTYNPIKEGWSYDQENKVTDISESTKDEQQFITAYPLKETTEKGIYHYDTNTIINDILSNDISSNFYSYNIPIIENKSGTANYDLFGEIAKNNYTNWKNTSVNYLRKLDEINIPLRVSENVQNLPYDSIISISKQWTDYTFLVDIIEEEAIKSLNEGSTSKDSLIKTSKELQNFYKKYVNALPLRTNPIYLKDNALNQTALKAINFDDQLFSSSDNNIYTSNDAKTPFKLATRGNNYLFYGSDSVDSKWNIAIKNFVQSGFSTETKKVYFNNKDVLSIDLNEQNDWSVDDYREFNTYIILWYWIHFEAKIGTILMEATYQKENNVVQQAMKKALENGTDYNITTNLVPFNREIEELGTMINGTYFTDINEQNIKIYGLNEDSTAVNLVDNSNTNLVPNLFKKLSLEYQDYIPIVINQTTSKKLNLGVKDTMDISILRKILANKVNQEIKMEDVKMGIKSKYAFIGGSGQTTNGYISEHKKNYFAYNDTNTSWSKTLNDTIPVATIADKKIASDSLSGLAEETEVQKAANNSEIKKIEVGATKQFVIVGVAENYGNSKAWISNDNANEILGYDQVKKYYFNNFFLNEWRESPALKSFYNDETMYEISPKQWSKFIDYIYFLMLKWNNASESEKFITGADNPYDEFINMFLKFDPNIEDISGYKTAAKFLWEIFNNEYPVFNYKYSLKNSYNDQLINTSKTQVFGDYSAIGMVGKSTLTIDDETNTSKISYTEGYRENSLNVVDSLQDQRDLLNEVESIISIVVYLITFIALLISTIIIVITTILIIGENAQFIATMKILGYTNRYVMTQILGIYVLPILCMYGAGFSITWFGIEQIVAYMSLNYSFVIPYNFVIWTPFIVLGILFGIYLITILISYKQFTKIRPIDSLIVAN